MVFFGDRSQKGTKNEKNYGLSSPRPFHAFKAVKFLRSFKIELKYKSLTFKIYPVGTHFVG